MNDARAVEFGLDEVMDKPLSDDIVDQMAADDTDRQDMLLMLEGVNPMQYELILRMLKTLKVTARVITDDMLDAMEGESDES